MTHSEIIATLIGPVSPTGDHGEDQTRLANLRTMSVVLLDLLGDIIEAAKSADRQEASVQAIGYYAKNTIGIVNENTGAWDENAKLQAIVDKLRHGLKEASHMIYGELYPDHPTVIIVREALEAAEGCERES